MNYDVAYSLFHDAGDVNLLLRNNMRVNTIKIKHRNSSRNVALRVNEDNNYVYVHVSTLGK
jgi:hypothetical protein